MLGDPNSSSSAIPITDVDCKGPDLDKLFRRHLDILLQRLDERLAQHQQEIKDIISHRTSTLRPFPPAPPQSGSNLSPRGLLSSISPRGLMENAALAASLVETSRSPRRFGDRALSASLCDASRSPRRYGDKVQVGSRPASRGHRPPSRGQPQREASTPPGPPRGESNADAVISFTLPGGTMETEVTAHASQAPFMSPRTVPPGSPPTLDDSTVEEMGGPPFSKENLRNRSAIGIQRRFSQDMWRQKIRHKLQLKGTMPTTKHRVFKPADFLTAHSKQEAVAKQSVLAGIVFTDCFDLVSSFLIVANCIFIAVQLEFVTAEAEIHGREVTPAWSLPLELFFCIVFGIEFMLRCFAHGRGIFHAKDWQWTVFDGSVVLVSVVELTLDLVADSGRIGNTSFFRSMRALRTTRAIRVVRVFRFFKELRMLILSILGSFKTLVWSAVMMVLFWYVCGVTLTTATYEVCSISADVHEDCPALKDRFGTLRRAVLALYMSMAGGVDWDQIYNVMGPMSELYSALFLVYLFFTMFGVLNIVTGIFVETAKEAGSADRDGLVRAQMRHQDRYMSDMIRLFQEIDCNGSGRISREEFHWYLADERALAYFEALKLDISDVSTLFDLLDSNGSGGIDMEEFLSGCQRLRGESRALDLAVLRAEMLSWMGHFSIFAEKVEQQLETLARKPGRPHTTCGCGERRAWTSSTVGP